MLRTRDHGRGFYTALAGARGALLSLGAAVWLCSCGPDHGRPAPAPKAPERKLLLIGLDGADWDIIDPLLDGGELPHLARLVSEGCRAPLKSLEPILSPVVWTSIATGKGPLEHGILDFFVQADDGTLVPVTSTLLQARPLWDILGQSGVKVSVTGWWASWPAQPVNGFVVTDRLVFHMFGMPELEAGLTQPSHGQTWPEELAGELRPLVVGPESLGDEELAAFVDFEALGQADEEDRFRLRELRTFLAAARSYEAAGLELLERQPKGFHAIYNALPDRLGHVFMQYRPPRRASVDERRVAAYGGAVDAAYREADAMLGRVLGRLDAGWNVMLLSDHGFRHAEDRPVADPRQEREMTAAGWHDLYGVFVLWGPDIRSGVRLPALSVLDVVPTLLALYGLPVAEDMPGRVVEEALTEDFLKEHPVASVRSYEPAERPAPRAVASAEDAAVLEQLRALGYLVERPGERQVDTQRFETDLNRGAALLSAGRLEEARREFERAAAAGAGAAALVPLAETLMALGKLEAAERSLLKLEGQDPQHLALPALRGRLAFGRGQLAEAEKWLAEAVRVQPADATAFTVPEQLQSLW